MALPATVTKEEFEKLPEVVRDHYRETEGKFHLSLVPKEKVDEFRNNNIELMKERDALRATAEKYKDLDPDKAREALKKLQELGDQKLLSEGKFKELLEEQTKRMRDDYEAKLTAADTKTKSLTGERDQARAQLEQVTIQAALRDAAMLPEVGILPTAIPDLLLRARGVWVLDKEGKPVPMNGDQVIRGKDAVNPMTFVEWITGLQKDAPHLFKSTAGGGADNDRRGGAPAAGKRSQMTVAQKSEYVAKYGREAYEKLPY